MSEYRTEQKELIGCGTFGQLSVIGVLVIVTIMDRIHIWQRLRVQGKQDRSQHATLGNVVHKRAGGGHNTINNDWLKTAAQVGYKPVEDCTPNTKGCLKSFQQYRKCTMSKAALWSIKTYFWPGVQVCFLIKPVWLIQSVPSSVRNTHQKYQPDCTFSRRTPAWRQYLLTSW